MRKALLIVGVFVLLGVIVAVVLTLRNRRQSQVPADQTQPATPSLPALSLQPLVETPVNFAAVAANGERLIYIEANTNVIKQLNLTDGSAETIARIPKALSPVDVAWSSDLSFGLIDALEEGKQDRQFYLLKKEAKEIVKLDPKIVAANFTGSGKQYLAQKLTDGGSELLLVDPSSSITSMIGQLGAEPRVIRPLIGDRAVILPNIKENGREKIIVYEAGKLRDIGIVELGTVDLMPLDARRAVVDQFDAEKLTYQLAILDLTTGKITDTGISAQVADAAYQSAKQQLLAHVEKRLIAYSLVTKQLTEVAQDDEQMPTIQRIIIVPPSGNVLLQINNKLLKLSI